MRNKIRYKTLKRYLIHPATVRAEIRRNPILRPYLGHWNASARVSGWGHTHGYIQVESDLIESNHISRDEWRDVCENVYSTKVYLYCEFEHCKNGWTEKHLEELNNILKKYNIKLEDK